MQENYADPVDRATVEQDRLLEEQLRSALAAKPDKVLAFIGECHNCGESLEGQRFCDVHCRDDFELRAKRRRVNGTR